MKRIKRYNSNHLIFWTFLFLVFLTPLSLWSGGRKPLLDDSEFRIDVSTKPSEAPDPGGTTPVDEGLGLEGETLGVQESLRKITVLWAPPPWEDPMAAATFLEGHPHIRVSALLPDDFFADAKKAWPAWQTFRKLIEKGQMEMVLFLSGEPPLPLLLDTDLVKLSTGSAKNPPERYSHPEDVLGHIAQAQSRHKKRWRQVPSGMAVPGNIIVGPEIVQIEKMKVKWLLLSGLTDTPGIFGGLPLTVLQTIDFPSGKVAKQKKWHDTWNDYWPAWSNQKNPSSEPTLVFPPIRVTGFQDLAALGEVFGGTETISWITLSQAVKGFGSPPIWPGLDQPTPDLTPWVGETEENVAWRVLGVTRKAIEEYKNSGRADVRKLDLALRELYSTQKGKYFYFFGNDFDSGNDSDLRREFLAGLSQVFRIMGRPVPMELFSVFGQTSREVEVVNSEEGSFKRKGDSLRWGDARKDDRGPGDYFYPTGENYPPGSWDLVSFKVDSGAENISFTFSMETLPNPGNAPSGFSLPLIDVYIDINQSPGAGAESLLPQRPGLIESRNAWEYALSVHGWGAVLFKHASGARPRAIAQVPSKTLPQSKAFRVSVPRHHFRGQPDRWSYGVLVMGLDPRSVEASQPGSTVLGRPMSVFQEPGAYQFGGAWAGVQPLSVDDSAPPFLDLLVPPGLSQKQLLGVYKKGRDVVIPFVKPL